MMKRFIALDLETTGLDRQKDEVIEIALVLFEEGLPTQTLSKIIRPRQPVRPFIQHLTGISSDELDSASTFEEHADEILQFIGEEILVAYNDEFDRNFLNKALTAAGKKTLTNRWLDALLAARTAWPRLPNHKLETVVEFLQLPKDTAHRALPDAIWAGNILLRALKEVEQWPLEGRKTIAHLSRGTPWDLFSVEECNPTKDLWKECVVNSAQQAPPLLAQFSDENNSALVQFLQSSWQEKRIAFVEKKRVQVAGSLFESVAAFPYENGERMVVVLPSDQLIPWKNSFAERGIKVAVVRRYDRFICKRRLELLSQEAELALTPDERQQLMPMLSWWCSSRKDELLDDHLGFNARRNFQLWQKCCGHPAAYSYTDTYCLGAQIRERAEQSSLLLIDHEYFFHDLKNDLALLPRWNHIVLTEAEHLLEQSVQQSEKFIRFYHLRNIIQRFHNPWAKGVGLLYAALRRRPNATIFEEILAALQNSERELQRLFVRLGEHAAKLKTRGPFSYRESLIGTVRFDLLNAALIEAEKLAQQSEVQSQQLAQEQEWFQLLAPEFAILKQELQEFRTDLHTLLEARDPQLLYWIEEWQNPHRLQMHGALRSTAELIGKPLLRQATSITWVGAPLAARHKLTRFLDGVGIRPSQRLAAYGEPTPHTAPALLCNTSEACGDNSPHLPTQLQLVKEAAAVTPGRIVVLLSTEFQLTEWAAALQKECDRLVLSEGIDGYLNFLLEQDRDKRALILATDWKLSTSLTNNDLLVLPRIPFPQGRSVYLEQLASYYEYRKKNPVQNLLLPEAALQLRHWLDAHPSTPRLVLDPRAVKSRYAQELMPLWGNNVEQCEEKEKLNSWLQSLYPTNSGGAG